METIDKTGQPRSDEDLQEAIDACKTIMVKHGIELPLFAIHAPCIIELLEELKWMRGQLAEARKRRLEQRSESER